VQEQVLVDHGPPLSLSSKAHLLTITAAAGDSSSTAQQVVRSSVEAAAAAAAAVFVQRPLHALQYNATTYVVKQASKHASKRESERHYDTVACSNQPRVAEGKGKKEKRKGGKKENKKRISHQAAVCPAWLAGWLAWLVGPRRCFCSSKICVNNGK
jgi:hypothetical protein